MHPRPDPDSIDPKEIYRVAVSADGVWAFGRVARMDPLDYRLSGFSVAEAMERFSHLLQ